MRFPWVDAFLTLVIVVGVVFVWQSASERSRLQAEHGRLKRLTGELIPTDPTKIYVRAIDTADPLHFAWRVYFPPNYPLNVRHTRGGSSSGWNSEAVHAIFRVRLREVDGRWAAYHRFHFSSGLSSLDPQVGDFLREHPEQLQVEQLGSERTEELDPASEFVLLKATLPENETGTGTKEANRGANRSRHSEPVLHVRIGPPNRAF